MPDRGSLGYSSTDVPTKIVEHDEEHENGGMNDDIDTVHVNSFTPTKGSGSPKESLLHRPAGTRISALGSR